jgi:hypothetical protein
MCRDDAQAAGRDATCGVGGTEEWTSEPACWETRAQRSEAAVLRFDWLRRLQACHFMGKVAGDRATASSAGLCVVR